MQHEYEQKMAAEQPGLPQRRASTCPPVSKDVRAKIFAITLIKNADSQPEFQGLPKAEEVCGNANEPGSGYNITAINLLIATLQARFRAQGETLGFSREIVTQLSNDTKALLALPQLSYLNDAIEQSKGTGAQIGKS